jgi:hypothetical protein
MQTRAGLIGLMIVGSFFVYCAQEGMGRNGMVPPANGDGTSDAAQTPTTLADQEFGLTFDGFLSKRLLCSSPAWDISGYRQVVVHADTSPLINLGQSGYGTYVMVKNGVAGFVASSPLPLDKAGVMVDARLGAQMKIAVEVFDQSIGTCPSGMVKATVVGWK